MLCGAPEVQPLCSCDEHLSCWVVMSIAIPKCELSVDTAFAVSNTTADTDGRSACERKRFSTVNAAVENFAPVYYEINWAE